MSAANEQQFMLQWKGRQSGPLSLLHIREQLGLGEISRMHQVSFNGRWITLGEFLDKHAGPSPEEKLRAEAAKREQQMRHKFETELAAERVHRNALEHRLEDARRYPAPTESPKLGQEALEPIQIKGESDKRILPAFLLVNFFGLLGIHRVYVGKKESGIAMFVLSITVFGIVITAIWALLDFASILCGTFTDGEGRKITKWT